LGVRRSPGLYRSCQALSKLRQSVIGPSSRLLQFGVSLWQPDDGKTLKRAPLGRFGRFAGSNVSSADPRLHDTILRQSFGETTLGIKLGWSDLRLGFCCRGHELF
jgi:hypothetical protein